MNPFLIFRLSVVAPIPLCLASAMYASWAEPSFSQNWRDLIAWNGDGGMLPNDFTDASMMTWAYIIVLAVTTLTILVNQVLFYFYWRHSRIVYLISYIILYPLLLLSGISILTPVEYVLYDLATFVSGMALALAYFSPVAERFRRGEEIKPKVIP